MHLVEILLPLRDAERCVLSGRVLRRPRAAPHREVRRRDELPARPAEGRWHGSGATQREDIAVVEVMTRSFDREWWTALKQELTERFRQEELIVRCQMVDLI